MDALAVEQVPIMVMMVGTFEARRQRVLSENLQTGSKLEATEVLLQP